MSGADRAHWTKGHGLGNDYLVVEPGLLPKDVTLTPDSVRLICDRHRGVGSDGILELLPPNGRADRFKVRIWNPDGSIAEKSGNGIRIFAKYLYEHGHTTAVDFTVVTPGGEAAVTLELAGETERVVAVTVDMGRAAFDARERLMVEAHALDVTVLSVGNPHCVVFVPDLGAVDLARLGPAIERHPAFPERTNVQFAMPVDDRVVRALVWERGAGVTQASGSSACAVAAACHRRGLVGPEVAVAMPGGELTVRVGDDSRLWLHGPVEEICRGMFSGELVARLRVLSSEVP